MDPYEAGMTIANGLHSIMDERIARNISRQVQGRRYNMFYNPMWSRLGDQSDGPPGTYFYNSGQPVNHYWHTFDQVLIRPELSTAFNASGLQVVTKAGESKLLRESGRIDRRMSDHLPLLLRLDVEGRV
jgi:hypothetical protein